MELIETDTAATVRATSTQWGSGWTGCFLCGIQFRYTLTEGYTLPTVSAPSLCNCTAAPGSHAGNCHAMGGDLCSSCERSVRDFPDHLPKAIQLAIEALHRRAEALLAYMTVPWTNGYEGKHAQLPHD